MKKDKIIFIFCVTSFLCTASFAFVSKKNTSADIFYCPTAITCAKDDKVKSCKVEGKVADFWDKDEIIAGSVVKGTYHFVQAESSFESKDSHFAACEYEQANGKRVSTLSFGNKPSAFVEASVDGKTHWSVTDAADCKTESVTDCPFYEPGLMVDKALSEKAKTFLKAQFSANGNVIKNDDKFGYNPNRFSTLTYDEVLSVCGSVKECEININLDAKTTNKPVYPINVGSVQVDMTTGLQIVKINSNELSGYVIKKVKPFNTIVFEKLKK